MTQKSLVPIAQRSLVLGAANLAPGGLCALTLTDGIVANADRDAPVHFGRNRPDVDLAVGENDVQVSRRHGSLAFRDRRWWITNTGRTPIRLPHALMLHRDSEPLPLDAGYTPLFLQGTRGREHLLELYVADAEGGRILPNHAVVTHPPRQWTLSADERLVLVTLGQRYLMYDPHPQPLSRQQVAAELAELRPRDGWSVKRVEHIVSNVRTRLSKHGVRGLLREEVGEPIGVTLTVNLLRELISSTTLVPLDLNLLDDPSLVDVQQ